MLLKPLHFLRGIIDVEEETCKNITSLETGKKPQVDMFYCTVRWGAARTPFPQCHYGKMGGKSLAGSQSEIPQDPEENRRSPQSSNVCCYTLHLKQ